MRPLRHNLCALRLARCKSFPYVIGITGILPYNRMLPYKHFSRSLEIFSACTILSHGSIMLPPRQPRVFARLARWQKVARGKLPLINRPWKCKKGKDRRLPLVHSRNLAEHDNFTRAVSRRYREEIRTALRTNQIAGFVTVPSWKKIKHVIFTCEDMKFSRESSLGISLVFI